MTKSTLKNPVRPASRARRVDRSETRKLVASDLRKYESTLPKKSHARIVVSGNIVEEYRYESPYFYNLGPAKDSRTDALPRVNAAEKRDDHILRSRRMIRRLVDANATKLPIFVTYTFKKNIKTLEEANPLFSAHVKELQRRYGKLKYLCVPEFQKRGAVHYHVIYFDLPYIHRVKEVFSALWPYGYSQVRAIRKIKRVGLYVAKYLQKGVDDKRSRGKKSYFASRNLIRPYEIRDEQEVDKFIGSCSVKTEFEGTFESPFGSVRYYRHKIQTQV